MNKQILKQHVHNNLDQRYFIDVNDYYYFRLILARH